MPNIIITEYCNLSCPYCFANTMIKEHIDKDKLISFEQLNKILNWLLPTVSSLDRIGIIGGEPTLHPEFSEILARINTFNDFTNSSAILFTNGIELERYLSNIGPNMSILINTNNLNEKNLKKFYSSLDTLNYLHWFGNKKATLGCNLYLGETNYQYFWNAVDRYPELSLVRMSITAPNELKLKANKELYYNKMKNILISFLQEAKNRNLKVEYDCNQIPLCFLTNEEKELVLSLGNFDNYCDPVIDITPDFKATSCFGTYDSKISCEKFDNILELYNYFKSQMILKTMYNNTSVCKDCEKLQLFQCQGGCLSFSSLDKGH